MPVRPVFIHTESLRQILVTLGECLTVARWFCFSQGYGARRWETGKRYTRKSCDVVP